MLYNLHALGTFWARSVNFYAFMNATLTKDIPWMKQWHAASRLLERYTRPYSRPAFDLGVEETTVICNPFGDLLRFGTPDASKPNLLMVAPMSGHYATLLRGTVREFMNDHNVYITDWHDAGSVPLSDGRFTLNSYVEYLKEYIRYFNGNVHLMAVCQPSVPAIAAVALMSEDQEPVPLSMVLMGGPVDTRKTPTEVNDFAGQRNIHWFKRHTIHTVPLNRRGRGRSVYPGFLQLAGFLSMNLDRHMTAHHDYFEHLVSGDGDSATQHEAFYDEYLAVMDLDAPFYLETIEKVFLEHHLPKGILECGGRLIKPALIERTALMTIEGELDDITGPGQTKAAHRLSPNTRLHEHYTQKSVGHYGIFNGRRFREEIAPRIRQFIQQAAKDPAV
ncbi:polyhydroxyalkanoate depolymerase [Sedimenticola selenatireducens]|uniref:Polyhydroxyalkanoate depolymerase n=1 Tax=Sedimenticola selenatireducens TaxID=191960 RepID=A0A558DRQ0_9GAMM|nr:polyhydroxyalkanoate depolymerase [Sedimenticola selenatireducens]TVO75799.1 polyhydroxyalkanoate depolymerase [Sedimenticola selenatireducens]TVT63659.1 MAG: polyhydroxyalkanoate depolymerase [Sedimenticola selenatireducens]